VYRDTQGAYHAVRVADGVTIATDPASAGPVFQSVLNQDFLQDPSSGFGAGDIYVRPALYELGATFAGLNVRRYTRLTIDPTAILQVPSGYAGPVFIIAAINDAGVAYAEICGGIIREAQPNRNQWTAFRLQASPADGHQLGVLYNKIRDSVVLGPGVGLDLDVTALKGFINANRFESIRFDSPTIGIKFSVPTTDPGGYKVGEEDFGILYNSFSDLQFQSDTGRPGVPPRYNVGIQEVTGVGNTFIATSVWDAPRLPVMTISPTADRTFIVGGALGGEHALNPATITDQGLRTKIL
jgi:hypothetical protein